MKLMLAWVFAGLAFAASAGAQQIVRYEAKGQFDAVKEDVALAIRDKGLVVDYTSYIGNMLERTGKDVGSARRVYERAEALHMTLSLTEDAREGRAACNEKRVPRWTGKSESPRTARWPTLTHPHESPSIFS